MSATIRRWRTFAVATVSLGSAVCIAATAGCSRTKSALDPYATATLTAGTGLGDLRLGETTFGAFLAKFGPGLLSVVVGDETAWEATFEHGQMSFLFVLTGDCQQKAAGTRVPAGPAVQAFLASHPECRDTPLTSISVAKPFFKGKTDQGVALGAPITATSAHGEAVSLPGRLVAGQSARNASERIEYTSGIWFLYDPAPSGKPEDAIINRITIFLPDAK